MSTAKDCFMESIAEDLTDYLLANGVIVQKQCEWIEDAYYDNPCVCSNCGTEAMYISRVNAIYDYDWDENLELIGHEETKEYIRTPYCYNCGAKLKEGEQG